MKESIEILKEHYIKHNYYDDETISIATQDLIKRIQELEEENRKLKVVRVKYYYGYENTHFYTKNDLAEIDKNRFVIEVKDGEFVDVKQLYIDALNSIPKQKVIDKLEELKIMLKATAEGKLQEYTPAEIIIKANTLQELLEGEK